MLRSTWDNVHLKNYPILKGNHTAEVIVIGGGLSGILISYLLSQAEKKVILLEAEKLWTGASLYTTAFITQVIDTEASDIIAMIGLKKAKLVWESHGEAINFIEQIIKKEKIDCEFIRCSNYIYAQTDKEYKELQKQFQALKKLGGQVVLKKKGNLGIDHHGYIEVKRQAKFHPTKFVKALLEILKKRGVLIFEKSEVIKISNNQVITKNGVATSPFVITATYQPFNNPIEVFLKKGMYKSYILEARVPPGLYKEGTYEDMDNPYHYFRIDPFKTYDRIVLGGEDHRIELKLSEKKKFNALEDYIKNTLGMTKYKITCRWAGPILEPADGLALIGEYDPGKLITTAFSGNGMTYAAISALLCRDIITGKKNKWIDLYRPGRLPNPKQLLIKGRDYAEEFVRGVVLK